jgi:hypothetical protein
MELQLEVLEIENSIQGKVAEISTEETKGQRLRSVSEYLDRQLELHRLERNKKQAELADQSLKASSLELNSSETSRAYQMACNEKRKLLAETQRLKQEVTKKSRRNADLKEEVRLKRDEVLLFYETSPQWAALNETIKESLVNLSDEKEETVEREGDTLAEIIATQEEQKFMRAKLDQVHRDTTVMQKQRAKLLTVTTTLRKSVKKAELAAQQKDKQVRRC